MGLFWEHTNVTLHMICDVKGIAQIQDGSHVFCTMSNSNEHFKTFNRLCDMNYI